MDFHFSRVSSVPLGLLCHFCCIVHMRLCHRDVGATIYNEQRRNDDPQHVHEHKIEVEIERVSIFAVYVTVSVLDPEVEQDSIQLTWNKNQIFGQDNAPIWICSKLKLSVQSV